MESRVTRVVGFLPANFQLHTLFYSRLRVGHGTDGQTIDGHRRFVPNLWGGDVIGSLAYSKYIVRQYSSCLNGMSVRISVTKILSLCDPEGLGRIWACESLSVT